MKEGCTNEKRLQKPGKDCLYSENGKKIVKERELIIPGAQRKEYWKIAVETGTMFSLGNCKQEANQELSQLEQPSSVQELIPNYNL